MIQTYFGNGKGKTSAAVGSAIRCAGTGNQVLFVEFLKNNDSAEFNIFKKIDNIDILYSDTPYHLYDNFKKEQTELFTKAYNKLLFSDAMKSISTYQMIILDEILDAVVFGYIKEDALLDLLSKLKDRMEIILTGHQLPEKIEAISDYISEVKAIRHPYQKGISSRKGIEF